MLTKQLRNKLITEVTNDAYNLLVYLESAKLLRSTSVSNLLATSNSLNLESFKQFSESIPTNKVSDTLFYIKQLQELIHLFVEDSHSWLNETTPSLGSRLGNHWLVYQSSEGLSLLKNYILNQTTTSPYKLAGGRFKDSHGIPTSFDVSVLFLLSCYYTGNLVSSNLHSSLFRSKFKSHDDYQQYCGKLADLVLKFIILTYRQSVESQLLPDITLCLVSDLDVFISDQFASYLHDLDRLLLSSLS